MNLRVCMRRHAAGLEAVGINPAELTSPESVMALAEQLVQERQLILDQVGRQVQVRAEQEAEAEAEAQAAITPEIEDAGEIANATQTQRPDMGAQPTEESEGDPGDNLGTTQEPTPIDMVLSLKGTKDETQKLTVVANALNSLLADTVENFEAYTDATGHLHVKMDLPPVEGRAPDTSRSLVQALVRMFRDGVTDRASKIAVEDTNSQSPQGGGYKLHISGKELSVVGKVLQPTAGGRDSAATRKNNVLAALAWMEERGVRLRQDNKWAQEMIARGEVPLPDDTIVGLYGRNKFIQWGQVKDATDDYATNQELFNQLRAEFTVAGRDGKTRTVSPYTYDAASDRPVPPQEQATDDERTLRAVLLDINNQINELVASKPKTRDGWQARREQLKELYDRRRRVDRAANILRNIEFAEWGLLPGAQEAVAVGEQTVQDVRDERANQTFIGGADTMEEGLEWQNEAQSGQDMYQDDRNTTRGGLREPALPEDFARHYQNAKTPEERQALLRERNVVLGQEPWLASVMDVILQAMRKIGLGNAGLGMTSVSGLDALERTYVRELPADADRWPRSRRVMWEEALTHNQATIAALRSGEVVARLVKMRIPGNSEGRSVPYIFVSDTVDPAARPRVLMHEVGHFVLFHQLQSLDRVQDGMTADTMRPAADQLKQLAADLGATNMADFHERFAELFSAWYFGGQNAEKLRLDIARAFAGPTGLAAGPRKAFVKDLFEKILVQLRGLYREIKKAFGPEAPATFNAWMREWLNRVDGRTPEYAAPIVSRYLAKDPAGVEFADFTPVGEVVRNTANKAARNRRARRLWASAKRFNAEVLRPVHQTVIQSADSYLRNNGLTWMADMFHRRPGVRTPGLGPTLGHEVMQQMARWQATLDRITAQHWPKHKMFQKAEEPQMLKDAREMLHGRMPADPNNPVYREMRKLYDEMHAWLRTNGIPVKKVKNYFPVVYSASKIMENQTAFVDQVIEGAEAWNAKVEEQAARSADLGQEAVDQVLSARIDNPVEYADELYRKLTVEPGMLETDDGLEIIAPGFKHKKHRTLPEEVRSRLGNFMEDDLVEVSMRYIGSAVKRVAWQKRFGLTDVLAEIEAAYTAGDSKAAGELKEARKEEYMRKYGVDIYDPSAGLRIRLMDDLRAGRITQDAYDRVMNKLIPAYQGRLGADMYPTLKRMSALAVLYQNFRLLAFGIFSQVVDLGTVGARAGDFGLFGKELARIMAASSRADQLDMAKAIGAIRDDLTEHVLNDSTDVLAGFKWIRDANNALFRYNLMHGATNAMRAVAVSIGRQVILQSAERGPQDAEAVKQLAKIGLTMERAQAWAATRNEGGAPGVMNAALEEWADVYGALNQFVDESVVRPTPMTRPLWGSDQRFAVLWHLKSFMWAYHEAIFRRVWQEGKDAKGLQRALPFLTLAAFTLPLAAAGMELRWLLAPPKVRPEGGWDYFMETVQRAGLLGLYQMWADFDDAEDYGRLAILSAAGPTLGQLEEITTKDMDYWAPRAVPLRPVFQTLDNFFGE